ncbi:MAG TPA: hypothetical protein VG076_17580 [Acidimicrobiales bacterium]|nr:hypothetical protein [Acidimicrobiales bacterium]
MRIRRIGAVAAIVALGSLVFVRIDARAWDTSPLQQIVTAHNEQCGKNDLPEGAIQGDVPKADQDSGRAQKGYNCGLELLGHTQLLKSANGDTRAAGNANMAWAGHCAYVAGSAGVNVAPQGKPNPPPNAGVAVISVADDGTPTFLSTLRSPGSLATSETLNAITTPQGRSILVIGQYGNDIVSDPKPMDVYDATDCEHPQLLTTYYWPENIHNLTITGDGKYVFATLPLQVVDISGLWATPPTSVRYVGDVQKAMDGPPVATGPTADVYGSLPSQARPGVLHPQDASHEAWPKPGDDGTLYVGGQTPEFEIFTILDIHDWLQGKGNPVVISQQSGRGHSVRTATIGGKPYVLHSEESVFGGAYGCIPQEGAPFVGPAQPYLTDISDPAHPKTVTEFGLEINDPKNCPQQVQAKENDSVHYHDVDNPTDTTFVMASMWNAGIRLFDVRNPKQPTEVAYFNPGDVDPTSAVDLDHAWGHIRYLPDKGQIWFGTADGGFWVVRIERQLRRYLNLDQKNKKHGIQNPKLAANDLGRPGTVGADLQRPPWGYIDISPYYCTLSGLHPA